MNVYKPFLLIVLIIFSNLLLACSSGVSLDTTEQTNSQNKIYQNQNNNEAIKSMLPKKSINCERIGWIICEDNMQKHSDSLFGLTFCSKKSDAIINYKDTCYKNLAIKTKDTSYCLNVVDKQNCLAYVTKDLNYCELNGYPGKFDDNCIFFMGVLNHDLSICKQLVPDSLDFKRCERIINGDTSDCGDNVNGMECLTEAAVALKDVSLCKRMLSFKSINPTKISELNNWISSYTACILSVAETKNDQTICQVMTERELFPKEFLTADSVLKIDATRLECVKRISETPSSCIELLRTETNSDDNLWDALRCLSKIAESDFAE